MFIVSYMPDLVLDYCKQYCSLTILTTLYRCTHFLTLKFVPSHSAV